MVMDNQDQKDFKHKELAVTARDYMHAVITNVHVKDVLKTD